MSTPPPATRAAANDAYSMRILNDVVRSTMRRDAQTRRIRRQRQAAALAVALLILAVWLIVVAVVW